MKSIESPITIRLKKLLFAVHFKLWTLNSLLITLFCILSTVNLKAQLYPVSTQVSAMPPLSMYLTDYGMGNNLQVSLIERDVMGEPFEAYLNIELEGAGIKLRTLPSFRPSAYIDIVPTVMVTLNNSDLAEYFNINSLSFEGISREGFIASGQQLPEGLYYLRIKAMHRFRGQQISNETMTLLRLQKGQPPFINQPFENAKVPENPMQNFTINWTNRNPISFNQTNIPAYHLQMWEMLDPSQDPNIIVNSNYPPILDEFTTINTYQYGLSNTPLTAGKTYVIRVRVVDPEDRDVYTNGGYSQVRKFVYGDACNPPTNLTAITDNRGIQVNWALTPNQGGYRFQHGRIDTAWTDADVLINKFSIEKTYPSAQYQMRVATVCSAGKQSEYSEIVYIGTPPSGSNNQCVCGGEEPKINNTNKKLLQSLKVGDKFGAYDFDVTVTQVFRNDSTGYKGEGKTPFHMLGGVDVVCYFDGITINTDHRVIRGEVRLQSKPYVFSDKNIKQFKEDFKDTKEMLSQNDAVNPEPINVDATIGTITYDSTQKQIVINDAQGNTVKTLTSGKDYKITDKDGNVYLVSKDNKVSKQPKATESTVKGGNPVKEGGENYDIHFTEDQPILTFEAHPQQTWGFDAEPMNSMVKTLYESIINTQRAYYVPYKSIGSAGTDKVIAKVEQNPEDVDLKRIKFKTNAGVAIPFEYDSVKQEWTITITVGLHRNDFSVFPYYGTGKDTLCGKLNVMPLDKKEVNLVLVPLNGFNKSNVKTTDIEAYLNTVYKQTNIAYKVSLDYAFSSASADLPLSVEHGKLEGEYSANQANVITEYQVRQPEQDNTIYLFLCKEGSNDAVKGHTPVNRSYGFLFGETLDKRTIAHEVGHGYPLALEHPFTTGGATGTFSNLMDYATGTYLTYMQWGKAHNPKLKVRFGQDAKEGQSQSGKANLLALLKWIKDQKTEAQFNKASFGSYNINRETIDLQGKSVTLSVDFLEGNKKVICIKDDYHLKLGADLSQAYHAEFSLMVRGAEDDKNTIKIYTRSYNHFKTLMDYLGVSMSSETKERFQKVYSEAIFTHRHHCDGLDLIYESIPDFVISEVSDEDKYSHLKVLLGCDVGNIGIFDNNTDEPLAINNILTSYQKSKFLYDKLNGDLKTVANLYEKLSGDYLNYCLELLTDLSNKHWVKEPTENTLYLGKNAYTLFGITDGEGEIKIRSGIVNNNQLKLQSYYENSYSPLTTTLCHDVGGAKKCYEGVYDLLDPVKVQSDLKSYKYYPALYFHAESKRAEWDRILDNVAKLGVISAGRTILVKEVGGLVRTLAITEVVNYGVNKAIVSYKDEIKQQPWGDKFLDIWQVTTTSIDVLSITVNATELIDVTKKGVAYLRNKAKTLRSSGKATEALELENTANKLEDLVKDKVVLKTETSGSLVQKLSQKAHSVDVNWANIQEIENLKIFDGLGRPYSASGLWNAKGENLYDLVHEGLYIKYDAEKGRLLFGNINTKQIYGFYLDEGRVFSEVPIMINDPINDLLLALEKIKTYHGVGGNKVLNGKWTSGAVIKSTPDKTTTILGSFYSKDNTGNEFFDMPKVYEFFGNLKNADFGAKKGGFNVLNVNDAYYEQGVFFEKYNKPWLETAIARGDEFYAVSDPRMEQFIYKKVDGIIQNGKNGAMLKLTGFGKEVEILYSHGYKYDYLTHRFVK